MCPWDHELLSGQDTSLPERMWLLPPVLRGVFRLVPRMEQAARPRRREPWFSAASSGSGSVCGWACAAGGPERSGKRGEAVASLRLRVKVLNKQGRQRLWPEGKAGPVCLGSPSESCWHVSLKGRPLSGWTGCFLKAGVASGDAVLSGPQRHCSSFLLQRIEY